MTLGLTVSPRGLVVGHVAEYRGYQRFLSSLPETYII